MQAGVERSARAGTATSAAVLALLLGVLGGCGPSPDRPPNLLLVSLDTLRADHLGAYGYDRPTSPELDALAEEAVLFERAYSQSPKTAESHMTLFTGLHPQAHRVLNWVPGSSPPSLSPEIPTLAGLLREAGYRTLAVHAGGNVKGELGFEKGFEAYVKRDGAPAVFEKAREVAGKADEPWFLFVHTYEIHDPYVPPEAHARRFVDPGYRGSIIGSRRLLRSLAGGRWWRQHTLFWKQVDPGRPEDLRHLEDLYDAGIHHTDQELGTLLDWLDRDGPGARTVVVVLSDHGEEFREHGGFLHDNLHREVLQVPLLMRFPGDAPALAPRRISAPVRLVDVMPTLLRYLERPVPEHVEGRSLLPLLRGEARGPERIRSEWRGRERAALAADGWKLIRGGEERKLYDLERDPDEQVNRSEEAPERRRRLEAVLDRLLAGSRRLARGFRAGREVVADRETRRELQALGYVEGGPEEGR